MEVAAVRQVCPWCLTAHHGKYLLCDQHETQARFLRAKRGLPVLGPPEPRGEEPDD